MLVSKILSRETTDLKNPAPWFAKLFGYEAASGERVTVESALAVPTVYACVNYLANSIAKVPFQTIKRTSSGREKDKSHPVAKLLEVRPNPYMSPFKFKHLVETHRNLWGNAYININWGADGRPKELWLLNPAVTEPYVDVDTNELWYLTTLPNGKYVKIGYGDIIHLTTLSLDGLKGKSPIQIARESIGTSQAAQKFKGKFYRNGTATNGIITAPGALEKTAKDKLRQSWEEANSGVSNAQRIAILDAGLDFKNIGMPLKDAQFIETMKFDKAEIATIYNIPLHIVNELDRATFSNMEQQSLDVIQNTLSPIFVQYEQELTYQLFSLPEQKQYYIKANLNSLMRADSESRANFYEKMLDKGAFSINKVLELEDEDGIGPAGDIHRVDLNHVSIDIADDYQLAKAGALKGDE